MARLTVLLPAHRDRCGRATLVSSSGELLYGPFRVLGTASRSVSRRNGNPTHDRLRPFGDPPCGIYVVASMLPPGALHPRRPGRFGKLGALVLEATSGEALAAKRNGRDRVVLHGGPRDARRRLARTRGGLRVPNRRLAELFAAINRTQLAGDPLSQVDVVDVDPQRFSGELALGPAVRTARRDRAHPQTSAATAALVAMAAFGVTRTTPTRRGFLRAALLAIGSVGLMSACLATDDRPGRCDNCQPGGGGGTGMSGGSGSSGACAPGSGSGSGSGSACGSDGGSDDGGYGTGGGVG